MGFKNALGKLGLIEEAVVVPPIVEQHQASLVDSEIAKTLSQSLQDSKLSGFDYLKYIAATDEMKKDGGTEAQSFKMAFTAAKQVGVDKDSLIKSAQHYLDVLKLDVTAFDTDFVQPETKAIQAKETRAANLAERYATLNEQLTQINLERAQLAGEVQKKKDALTAQQAAFEATLKTFTDDIEGNIVKINKYL